MAAAMEGVFNQPCELLQIIDTDYLLVLSEWPL